MLPKLKNSNVERRFGEGRSEDGQFILKLKGGEVVSVVNWGMRLPDGNCPPRWQSEDKMTPMYRDLASAAGDSNNNQLKLGESWTIDRINTLNIQIMF